MAEAFKPTGIPKTPANIDPGLRKVIEAIRETLEVRTQQRGSPLDASPSFRDLVNSGLLKLSDGATIGGTYYTKEQLLGLIQANVPDWVTSDTAPPAPTNLAISGTKANMVLTWDASGFDQYGQTEIWRAPSNDLSAASRIGSVSGTRYLEQLPPYESAYYYWIRDVSLAGLASPFNDVNGISIEPAPGPSVLNGVIDGDSIELQWTTPTSNLAVQYYEIRYGGTGWMAGDTRLAIVSANAFRFSASWAGERVFRIRAYDINDTPGAVSSHSITISLPLAPVDFAAVLVQAKVQMSWVAAFGGSLPIRRYELRHGASFEAGAFVAQIDGTSFRHVIDWVGSRTFWLAAIDTAGNAGPAASQTVTITVPAAPSVSAVFAAENFKLSWPASASSIPVAFYEIRAGGTSWANSTKIGSAQALELIQKVSWLGQRLFFVAAVDINGNYGTPGSASLTVEAPNAPGVTSQVVDNNVLLYWTQPSTGSLPVATFEIRRGATWAGATLIGPKAGGFTTIFETISGTYTYWIAAIDTAGNYGTPGAVAATVSQPPDYQLNANYFSAFAGTLSNAVKDSTGVVMPVNTTETFAQHFTTRSWAGPAAQVAAGYPRFIQPTPSTGYYEEVYDAGTLLASMKVSVAAAMQTVAGAPTTQITISLSANGSTYTDYPGATQVFGTNFRYVKVRIAVTANASGQGIVRLTSLNIRLDVKLKNDAGMVSCNASDSGGTQVNFTIPFIDVTSITVTPMGGSAAYAVADFVDAPNPVGFKALLFNSSGTRVSGNVSWAVKGY